MNMMMKKTALAVALGLALGLTACGGGGGDSGSAAAKDMCQNIAGMQTNPLEPGVVSDGVNCTVYGADPKAAEIFKQHGMKKEAWYQLDLVNAEYAFSRNIKGQGEVITIFDNGVLSTHEQFVGKLIGPDIGKSTCPDPYWHGTMIASSAAGISIGVAPLALIQPADWCDPKPVPFDTKILNLSGGMVLDHHLSQYSPANYPSMLVVESAGNSAVPMDQYAPDFPGNAGYIANDARWTGRLILAGTAQVNDPDSEGIGNYPGENPAYQAMFLNVPFCNGFFAADNGGYTSGCGTSGSVTGVTGAAAILRQAKPGMTPEQIRDVLLKSANKGFSKAYQDNTCGKNKNTNCGLYYFGQGMLDIEAALKMVGVN